MGFLFGTGELFGWKYYENKYLTNLPHSDAPLGYDVYSSIIYMMYQNKQPEQDMDQVDYSFLHEAGRIYQRVKDSRRFDRFVMRRYRQIVKERMWECADCSLRLSDENAQVKKAEALEKIRKADIEEAIRLGAEDAAKPLLTKKQKRIIFAVIAAVAAVIAAVCVQQYMTGLRTCDDTSDLTEYGLDGVTFTLDGSWKQTKYDKDDLDMILRGDRENIDSVSIGTFEAARKNSNYPNGDFTIAVVYVDSEETKGMFWDMEEISAKKIPGAKAAYRDRKSGGTADIFHGAHVYRKCVVFDDRYVYIELDSYGMGDDRKTAERIIDRVDCSHIGEKR